jgi:group I intron endonuclease
MIGIYRIINKKNGKCYYGSSKNIEKRWKRHKTGLKHKNHHNLKLQRAWDKYGEDSFDFEVVEECELNNLLACEQKYLDLLPEYNVGIKSSGGDNLTNNPNRDEIINKMTSSIRDKYSKLTREEVMKIHSKPMESNPNWKGGVTYNYCKCGKRIVYKAKSCIKCLNREGENNPFYGKHHTEENKAYLSKINKERPVNEKCQRIVIIDDVEYSSLKEASEKTGINWGTIRFRALSKNKRFENYKFKDTEKITYTDEEQKLVFANKKIGKPVFSNNKPIIIDGVEYRTLGDASKSLGIHKSTIKMRILSKSENFSNYKYK